MARERQASSRRERMPKKKNACKSPWNSTEVKDGKRYTPLGRVHKREMLCGEMKNGRNAKIYVCTEKGQLSRFVLSTDPGTQSRYRHGPCWRQTTRTGTGGRCSVHSGHSQRRQGAGRVMQSKRIHARVVDGANREREERRNEGQMLG